MSREDGTAYSKWRLCKHVAGSGGPDTPLGGLKPSASSNTGSTHVSSTDRTTIGHGPGPVGSEVGNRRGKRLRKVLSMITPGKFFADKHRSDMSGGDMTRE